MPDVREFPPRLPARFLDLPLNGGRVHSIAVDPKDGNRIMAAFQWGGLWRTDDGGRRWAHVDGLPTVWANDVAFSRNGPLIATLRRDNRVENGGGIWLSTDDGATWSRPSDAVPPPSPRIAARTSGFGISFAPDKSKRAYVGTDYGIAVTDDAGASWEHVMLEAASPVLPGQDQNAAFSVLALPRKAAMALTRMGVYLSRDGGESWANIRPGDFAFRQGFKNIDVSPLSSDLVFILENYSTLLVYEVRANRWTPVSLPPRNPRQDDTRGPFVRVSRSPTVAGAIDIWFGRGVVLYRATCTDVESVRNLTIGDWTVLGRREGLHDDSGHLGLNGRGQPVLYGCDGGLFRPSNADATTWESAAWPGSGMNSYQITDVAGTNVRSYLGDSTHLYFSTQDNAIWGSLDGGRTWPRFDCAEGFHVEVRKDAISYDEITVAYGKMGCAPPSMFSDAGLANPREVPDLDYVGERVGGLSQVSYIGPNRWIRFGMVAGEFPSVWVSDNNGRNWRRRAWLALQPRGVFAVAGPAASPTIYVPCLGSRRGRNGRQRIGLMRLTDIFGTAIRTYQDTDLIYLPDDGSLARRATEFDWQAVFGVDPADHRRIIAPDVFNGVVKSSRDGGASWVTDEALTNRVTQGGQLLLFDGEDPSDDAWRVQVTHVSFDPHYRGRIFVGTRDAGVIVSEDDGMTWSTVPTTERISYVTGFFFRYNSTVVVSSYGRGLWELDYRYFRGPFPSGYYCRGVRCIVRLPDDAEILAIDDGWWRDKDVTIFIGGTINGLDLSDRRMKELTVSLGTSFRRYIPPGDEYSPIDPVESDDGIGFAGLVGCQDAVERGEKLHGLVLEKGQVVAIISGKESFDDLPDPAHVRPVPDEEVPLPSPNVIIATSAMVAGTSVVGNDGVINLLATGFAYDEALANPIRVWIDGQLLDQTLHPGPNGQATATVKAPEGVDPGAHRVDLVQVVGNQELSAGGSFVKGTIDEVDEQEQGPS